MRYTKELGREEMLKWLNNIKTPAKILAVKIQEDTVLLRIIKQKQNK